MAKLFKRSIDWKKVGLSVVAIVLVLASVGGLVTLFGKQTKKISPTSWVVGGLDEDGKFIDDDQTLVNRTLIACEGLSVKKTFKGECSYEIFYFDENDQFLTKVIPTDDIYSEDYPGAVSCRIVIRPACPSDEKKSEFKISFWEVATFAKYIQVTVDKVQPEYSEVFEMYDSYGKTLESGLMTLEGGINNLDQTDMTFMATPLIPTNEVYDAYRVYICFEEGVTGSAYVAFADAELPGDAPSDGKTNNGKIIVQKNGSKVYNDFAHVFKESSMKAGVWYSVIVESPEAADCLRVCMPGAATVKVFGLKK